MGNHQSWGLQSKMNKFTIEIVIGKWMCEEFWRVPYMTQIIFLTKFRRFALHGFNDFQNINGLYKIY